MGPFLIVMLIISIITIQNKIQTEKELMITRLNNYAILLESGVLSFESITQKDKLESNLEENVLIAELIKKDYSTPYSTEPLTSYTSLDRTLVDKSFKTNSIFFIAKGDSYDYLYPITYGNSIVGVFHVSFLNRNINKRIVEYSLLIILLNLLGLSGSFLFIRFLVKRGILKGLSELMKGSKIITCGNLDHVIDVKSNDEIGKLTISFNQMIKELKKTTVSRDSLIKEVAERKKTEISLKKSEKLFKDIAFSSADWIWEIDEKWCYTYCSEKIEVLLGYKPEEIIGKTPFDLMPMEEAEKMGKVFHKITKNIDPIKDLENWNLSKNGKRLCFLTNGVPVIDEQGKLKGYRGVDKDITARKENEARIKEIMEDLTRSNRELDDFAHIASHDLQEPLRKIKIFSERLKGLNKKNIDEKSIDYLSRIEKAAFWMSTLINGLLSYSRITTKAKSFEKVDLNEIIKEVISDLEIKIQETEARIKIEELPKINADKLQMRQLFQNLIGNALKYHKKDVPPVVKIASEQKEEEIEITVEDNGIGFNQKHAGRIFGVFERLVGKFEYEGSGVGLAICKKIIERHKGSIAAKSEEGRGTVFVITLTKEDIKSGE